MKKKMLGIIAFAAIAAVAGWNYNQNMNNVNLSDLALENMEALASGEITTPTECPGGTVLCAWIIAGESVHTINYKYRITPNT